MGKSLDPKPWLDAVERIGLGSVILIIFALGIAIGFATRGPEWIRAISQMVEMVLAYRNARHRIPKKVKERKELLKIALEGRKREDG
jgi:uncharacterized membrane protein